MLLGPGYTNWVPGPRAREKATMMAGDQEIKIPRNHIS